MTEIPEVPEHGSTAGYHRHRYQGEDPCTPCKTAWAAYQRHYRASHPRTRELRAQNESARMRALWRLRKEFSQRFEELYDEELRVGWGK